MKAIQKLVEPQSLVQHRASANADYDNYQPKGDLRVGLCDEQGAICCYCLQRIHATPQKMKIEHWHSQANYSPEQLDYGNLLGACLGGQGRPPNLQHCDTKKGDLDLARNPATPAHNIEAFIVFLSDGSIESSDPVLDGQLSTVLNLNLWILKRNREAVLDAFQASLAGRGAMKKADWEKERDEWLTRSNGQLQEYCQVVVYWLRKKIARA
jgi:uncharacterized protein (TIGR02646 family)